MSAAAELSRPYAEGWYCVAFLDELPEGLTPVDLGRRLMLLRRGDSVEAYAADCPHRGAHLAQGQPDLVAGRCAVVCPYHGYSIQLGGEGGFTVPGFETMVFGGAVYLRLSSAKDHGWPAMLERLSRDFVVSPGIVMHLSAGMEEVIENGFDQRHFAAVHRLAVHPFAVDLTPDGALRVTSAFGVDGSGELVPYVATAISPGLILVLLGGLEPYGVITGAVPAGRDRSTARLSFLLPRQASTGSCDERRHDALKLYSHRGLGQDDAVWAAVNRDAPVHWTEEDASVRRFYAFCDAFRARVP